jgi:hypothetical protein
MALRTEVLPNPIIAELDGELLAIGHSEKTKIENNKLQLCQMKYVDQGTKFYESQNRNLQVKHLKWRAAKLGYQLVQKLLQPNTGESLGRWWCFACALGRASPRRPKQRTRQQKRHHRN